MLLLAPLSDPNPCTSALAVFLARLPTTTTSYRKRCWGNTPCSRFTSAQPAFTLTPYIGDLHPVACPALTHTTPVVHYLHNSFHKSQISASPEACSFSPRLLLFALPPCLWTGWCAACPTRVLCSKTILLCSRTPSRQSAKLPAWPPALATSALTVPISLFSRCSRRSCSGHEHSLWMPA